MHRDKKIGFALGILLLGIVGAFFFRNEPAPFAELPPLDDPAALDAEIAEKPITPYAPDANSSAASGKASPTANQWELPEIYRPADAMAAENELPIAPAAPAPINLIEPVPLPEAVQTEIEVGSPFGEAAPALQAEAPLPGNEAWTSVAPPPEATREKPLPELLNGPRRPDDSPEETPTPPASIYKIKRGDTLSDLAARHLGSSRRYMEIYEANRDKLRDPNDIRIGMTIRIPRRVEFDNQASKNDRPAKQEPPAQEKAPSTETLPPPAETPLFTPFSRLPLIPGPRRRG